MELEKLDEEIKEMIKLMMTCAFLGLACMLITYVRFPDKLSQLASFLFVVIWFLVGWYSGLVNAKKILTRK